MFNQAPKGWRQETNRMKRIALLVNAVVFLLGNAGLVMAQMSGDDLDQLLGPIALYPDPLIAEILPASTQPAQITLADRYVQQAMDPGQINQQSLDNSVKALARYPDVLKWMDDNMAWTSALGQAFVAQPDDVMNSIQRLRAKAQSLGNLQTTPQEQVVADNGSIEIVPSNPETIYVPVYQPAQVYYEPPPPGGYWTSWGVGFPIGIWLDGDLDWRQRHIFFWPHDHFRPSGWWHEAPERRPRPPTGDHGVAVWRPHDAPARWQAPKVDRGWPVANRETRAVPSPREMPRTTERPGITSRPAERPAPRPVERPVIPSQPVERPVPRPVERPAIAPQPVERPAPRPVAPPVLAPRPVQRPAAPAPRYVPPARGALIGVGSAQDTHAYSTRGQTSRGVISRPAAPAPRAPAAPPPASRGTSGGQKRP